jgi:hypothetical protein
MVRSNPKLDVLVGIILLVLCHAIAGVLGYALYRLGLQVWSADQMFFLLLAGILIGITQLIYVVPLCLWLRRRRQFETAKGVIIGAVITFLLNGSCFLYGLLLFNRF